MRTGLYRIGVVLVLLSLVSLACGIGRKSAPERQAEAQGNCFTDGCRFAGQ